MVKFAADENFNGHVLDGLALRDPDIDIVRIQDTEVAEADDIVILRWGRDGRPPDFSSLLCYHCSS